MAAISVSLQNSTDTIIDGSVRGHSVTVDRPQEKGGSDKGPMGGELLLLALGGCYLSTLLGVTKLEGPELEPGTVRLVIDGELVPAPTRLGTVSVTVTVPAPLRDVLEKPLLKAERGCIVHNSIKDSVGVSFDYRWDPTG